MPVPDTIRVSELPVSTTLNDDDFIIVNTQNIVTQGIETEDFIESLFGRDLTFTGTPTFSGGVVIDSNITIDGTTTLNNNITINGDLAVNGSVGIKLGELSDVNVATATAGQLLAYNAGASTWVAIDAPSGTPGGATTTLQFNNAGVFDGAAEVKYGNTSYGDKGLTITGTTDNLELSGSKVNSTGTLNLEGSSAIIIKSSSTKIKHGSSDRITVESAGVTLDGTTTTSDLVVTTSFVANGITYPTADGGPNQVMTTDGSGNLSFTTVTSGGGGGTNIPFQPNAPSTTTAGDLWMNSTTYKLYVWDGSWIATS